MDLSAEGVFLQGQDGGAQVQPKLKGHGSQAWADLCELFEVFEACRWLNSNSKQWEALFCSDLRTMLPPLERVALPGEWDRVVR